MCWTVFKVTTVYDRYVAAEEAELSKPSHSPMRSGTVRQPWSASSHSGTASLDKLKGNLGLYVSIYGGAPGQPQTDFYASPDQALFTANGGAINSWVAPLAATPLNASSKLPILAWQPKNCTSECLPACRPKTR
ncbi:MAG UNVERIFIED_CONTAM: hypothetical protein LVR18_25290 [Planctomycetaceae bacterium]